MKKKLRLSYSVNYNDGLNGTGKKSFTTHLTILNAWAKYA